jgi:Tetratricopeptide repeat
MAAPDDFLHSFQTEYRGITPITGYGNPLSEILFPRICGSLCKYAEAEPMIRQTLATERRVLGNEHSDTQGSMQVLGQVLAAEGHYPEAERLLVEAYQTRRRVLGTDDPGTAETAYDLGTLYAVEGRKEDALTTLTCPVHHGLQPSDYSRAGYGP